MLVAIPLDDTQKQVCVSFGRAPFFLFFDTQSKESLILDNPAANAQGGAGIQAAQFVVDNHAQSLITVRCGENAAEVFSAAQISIYKAEGSDAQENITLLIKDKLAPLTHFHAGFHGIQ